MDPLEFIENKKIEARKIGVEGMPSGNLKGELLNVGIDMDEEHEMNLQDLEKRMKLDEKISLAITEKEKII